MNLKHVTAPRFPVDLRIGTIISTVTNSYFVYHISSLHFINGLFCSLLGEKKDHFLFELLKRDLFLHSFSKEKLVHEFDYWTKRVSRSKL